MPGQDSHVIRRIDATGIPLLIVRIIVGGFFIYMGTNKLADPITFMKALRQYGMLPETPGLYLNLTAVVLPWMEIFAGTALLLGVYVRGAALAIVLMLAVFTPAVFFQALKVQAPGQSFFDIAFDCGCGTGVEIIWQKLLSNFGLFLLAILALFSNTRRFCLSLLLERRRGIPSFCHFCGYAVHNPQEGLCPDCAAAPAVPAVVYASKPQPSAPAT